jgi:hypothetical protein
MSSNNNKKLSPYLLVGSLTALGGIALGITGTWVINSFIKSRLNAGKNDAKNEDINEDGVYILENDSKQFLTNEEFQRYFEFNIKDKGGIELDWCLLEYALKLDSTNLRFFKTEQKTLAFEKFAVENNIGALSYCSWETSIFTIQNEDNEDLIIPYKKYEIHDFAYDLYGNEVYKYIDHPEGYTYDEIMTMPPPELQDMTVSLVFNTLQEATHQHEDNTVDGNTLEEEHEEKNEVENEEENEEENEVENEVFTIQEQMKTVEKEINKIVRDNSPDISKIEFTVDFSSDEESNKS